jgi:hypothetical protein
MSIGRKMPSRETKRQRRAEEDFSSEILLKRREQGNTPHKRRKNELALTARRCLRASVLWGRWTVTSSGCSRRAKITIGDAASCAIGDPPATIKSGSNVIFRTDTIDHFYLISAGSTGVGVVSWDQCFDRPVVLPDGKTLRTLEDARLHILSLPKSEHDTTAWQVAIEALLLAAGVSDAELHDHEQQRRRRELARDRWNQVGPSPLICPNRNRILLSSTLQRRRPPHFRLIAVNLNHWLEMGRIFQLIKGGQSKSRPSKSGGLIQAAKLSGKHWVEFLQRRLGSGR